MANLLKLTERYQLLLKTTESKSEEVVELRRHIAQLQELSGKQELNYQKSTHDLLTAQDQISRLRNDLSNAQSELELLRVAFLVLILLTQFYRAPKKD